MFVTRNRVSVMLLSSNADPLVVAAFRENGKLRYFAAEMPFRGYIRHRFLTTQRLLDIYSSIESYYFCVLVEIPIEDI